MARYTKRQRNRADERFRRGRGVSNDLQFARSRQLTCEPMQCVIRGEGCGWDAGALKPRGVMGWDDVNNRERRPKLRPGRRSCFCGAG